MLVNVQNVCCKILSFRLLRSFIKVTFFQLSEKNRHIEEMFANMFISRILNIFMFPDAILLENCMQRSRITVANIKRAKRISKTLKEVE